MITDSSDALLALSRFELVMFDLDDTLFLERVYLESAYREIGALLADSPEKAEHYGNWLRDKFCSVGRYQLFQNFLREFHLDLSNVETMLHVLRSHRVQGGLNYFGWVPEALQFVVGKCAIVTNGNPAQQRNKIIQLEPGQLTNRFEVFLANQIEPKPSPAVFTLIQKEFKIDSEKCLMVGDSETDRDFASAIGAQFIHVRILELALSSDS